MTLEERVKQWAEARECVVIDGPSKAFFELWGVPYAYVTAGVVDADQTKAEFRLFEMITARPGHFVWRRRPKLEDRDGGVLVTCRYVIIPQEVLGAFK